MNGRADRRARGARNVMVECLGLGWPAPLVDLPVGVVAGSLDPADPVVPPADPPVVVPFGGVATLAIEDAEPGVTYRVRADSGGTSLSNRRAEETGTGGRLDLVVPRVDRAVTFSVEATSRKGRRATLTGTQPVKVGLDRSLPLAVEGMDAALVPLVVDHGARVRVVVARTQEAVSYALLVRPPDDRGPDDQLQALPGDEPPAGQVGDGGAMTLVSDPLVDDCVLRLRADRSYGKGQRQATLTTAGLAVAVRAARDRPVTIAPAVSEHLGRPVVTIGGAQAGVRYDLVIGAVPDTGFSRAAPPVPATVAVAADAATVRVVVPATGPLWQSIPGHVPSGASATGRGRDLAIATPPLAADSTIVVRAVKAHGSGEAAFESQVPLAAATVALVRPDPAPPLRLVATIAGGELVGIELRDGQPGVFYALSAAGEQLGELYVHQRDPADPALMKGVGRIAVGIDLAVATDRAATTPRLACRRALPLTLSIEARRATTGLVRPLAATATITAPPAVTTRPAPDGALLVTPVQVSANATYQLLVNTAPRGDPVAGDAGSALATGTLPAGATIELMIADPPAGRMVVVRRVRVG